MIVVDQIVDAGLISLLLYGLQKMQNVAPTSFGARKLFKQMMPVPYGLGTMDGTLMIALILLLAHLFTKPMGGSRKKNVNRIGQFFHPRPVGESRKKNVNRIPEQSPIFLAGRRRGSL
jgi:hypothetical protein